MDPHVASGAIVITRVGQVVTGANGQDAGVVASKIIRAVMAFQTHGEHNRPAQQARVRGPMRKVASFASVHSNGFVFIEEGPAFFGVAFQARLLVGERLVYQTGPRGHTPGGGERSVRIVAVGAIHETFVDAMLERHGELCANFAVAAVAEIGLFLREQEFRSRGFMDRMTAGTDDFVERVRGLANICPAQSLGVTSKAVGENILGGKLREGDDGCFAAVGVYVGFAGSVTAFASGSVRRLLTGCDALKVRVLVEDSPNIRMAGPACFAAHVARVGYRLRDRQNWRTKYYPS